MKPSQDALDLDEAIKLFRVARGTEREESAKAYLDATVARLKAKAGRS
jgi:hypothetical protein